MIRTGLIGYGLAGRVFHAPLIAAEPRMELAVVATGQIGAAQRDYPGVVVSTPDDVVKAPDIDLVVIAAPNEAHFPLALETLKAGKAVVVDKPMTTSLELGRRLAQEADQRGLLLCPFHNRRWDDDFLTLRQVLASGAIGELVTFESRFDRFRPEVQDRWREQPGPAAGVWWDLGPHLIDQAVALLGRPEAVTADLAVQRPGAVVTDYAHVVLHYGARRAVLRAGSLVSSAPPRLCAEGTAGAFVTHGLDLQEDRLRRPGTAEGARMGELCTHGAEGAVHRRLPLEPGDYGGFYRAVADAMEGDGAPPIAVREALIGLEILEAAERSAAERRTVQIPSAPADR